MNSYNLYTLEAGETGTITYVIPFYTGFFVDFADLIRSNYRNTKREILLKLNSLPQYQTVKNDNIYEQWFDEDSNTQQNEEDARVWAMNENRVYGGTKMGGSSFLARHLPHQYHFIYQIQKPKEEINGDSITEHFYTYSEEKYSNQEYPEDIQKVIKPIQPNMKESPLSKVLEDVEARAVVEVNEILFYYHEFAAGAMRIKIKIRFNQAIEIDKYQDYTRRTAFVQFLFKFVNEHLRNDTNAIEKVLDTFPDITIFQFERSEWVKEFLEQANHKHPKVRLKAVESISRLDKRYSQVLNKLELMGQEEENEDIRKKAQKSYDLICKQPIAREEQHNRLSQLIFNLNDPDPETRRKAIRSIGNLRHRYRRAVENLEFRKNIERSKKTKKLITKTLKKVKKKKLANECDFEESLAFKFTQWLKKQIQIKKIKPKFYSVEVAEHFNIKRALWEHVIYEFHISEERDLNDDDVRQFHPLINSSQKQTKARPFGALNVSLDPKIRVYPGFGTSFLIGSKNCNFEFLNYPRVVEIAEYYYASTDLMDDLMFQKFAEFTQHRERITDLELIQASMNRIRRVSNLLDAFLLDVKDSIINFDKDAKQIWRALENEWYYSPMIENLTQKSRMLTEKYSEYLNELNEKRSEIFNKLAVIFTLFTVVEFFIELSGFISDRELDIKIRDFYFDHQILSISVLVVIGIWIMRLLFKIFRKLRRYGKVF